MSTKKIIFTKVKIDSSSKVFIELSVQKFNFPTEKGDKEIEKISFEASPGSDPAGLKDKDQLEAILKTGETQNLELSFEEEKVEIIVIKPQPANTVFAMSSGPEDKKKPPKIRVYEGNKTLNIEWNPDVIKIAASQNKKAEKSTDDNSQNQEQQGQNQSDNQNKKKSGDTDKQALIDKYVQEIKDKLKAAGITDKEIEILGNSWETNFRMFGNTTSSDTEIENAKTERIRAIDDWIAKKGQDNQQDQTPKGPTKEQIDEATEKLKNAKSEEELEEALKNARDTANNSSDEELKKQKEEKERELGEKNKQKAREIIRDEVNGVLEENGIKLEDLSTEVKQKYDELNNNNNNNNNIETSQAQTIRTEIFNDMGEKALEKLIAALEQAIKNKNKNEVESQSKKLQEFVNSQVDYKKLAYEKKRDEVQRLLDQAKNYSTQNSQNNEGFFRPNNPLMWVSGVAVVGIVAGAVLIVRSRKRKAVE
ncbi:MAG: hypothetical protein MRERV_9c020 [Mycoplasmataceae bacterium RV_VA103A]|nr:MAG: hypothetical protein MRERV_9c020 [Mycoplasmataceae bacterium RV_VA103A]